MYKRTGCTIDRITKIHRAHGGAGKISTFVHAASNPYTKQARVFPNTHTYVQYLHGYTVYDLDMYIQTYVHE
jgi:hypothetical protein